MFWEGNEVCIWKSKEICPQTSRCGSCFCFSLASKHPVNRCSFECSYVSARLLDGKQPQHRRNGVDDFLCIVSSLALDRSIDRSINLLPRTGVPCHTPVRGREERPAAADHCYQVSRLGIYLCVSRCGLECVGKRKDQSAALLKQFNRSRTEQHIEGAPIHPAWRPMHRANSNAFLNLGYDDDTEKMTRGVVVVVERPPRPTPSGVAGCLRNITAARRRSSKALSWLLAGLDCRVTCGLRFSNTKTGWAMRLGSLAAVNRDGPKSSSCFARRRPSFPLPRVLARPSGGLRLS